MGKINFFAYFFFMLPLEEKDKQCLPKFGVLILLLTQL